MQAYRNAAAALDVEPTPQDASAARRSVDPALVALCRVAGFYRLAAEPAQLQHELGLAGRKCATTDVCRAAGIIGLKSRLLRNIKSSRLARIPTPALVTLKTGDFAILLSVTKAGVACVISADTPASRHVAVVELAQELGGEVILLARQDGQRVLARPFGMSWFLPSIMRYKAAIAHVFIASLFVQIFALVTPLFFQIVVDKVLTHKGTSTLVVIVIGMMALAMFNGALQYLRSYALSHTTTRIDVELGARLFHHLLRLPLHYFETRATGQTVARLRELDTVRAFITGQALFSVIDLLFAFVFAAVLFSYSSFLALIVLSSIPAYVLVTALVRPALRERVREQFDRGAESQQFLVESVVGMHTLKAAAVEPVMQSLWEEKLSAYVTSAFRAVMLSSLGQNVIQYISTLTTAAIVFFGARSVIEGTMTVGQLIAFNMIAGQLTQPILRLSQLFQDFQQVQVSVARLGDVLNTPTEPAPLHQVVLPQIKGAIEFKNVEFRYRPQTALALSNISFDIKSGETIGIVGASGSGKSTLSKLLQRFYVPESGQVRIDGIDISQVDPTWLRRQVGVVLQDNVLFNRSIHDNIAFADPTMSREHVMRMAALSGAHAFISDLSAGYDTILEERGANLSGGQRQRIAIARALASDPRILIFDEATSALDYESERLIQNNMHAIVKGRTVIIIAHRLSTVRNCNRIIGMHAGRISEIGSHDELMLRQNGLYAQLWSLQGGRLASVSA